MYWVIQDNLYNEEGFTRLLESLERAQLPHSVHKVIPFVRELVPDVDPDGGVVVMGSYSLSYIAQAKDWSPGTFLNQNFTFETQRKQWGASNMLNGDAFVSKLCYVPEQINPFFIRPTGDGKEFAGEVMDWYSFIKWYKGVAELDEDSGATVTPDTMVMVCPKKVIYTETRCWMVDRKVVTASEYKIGNRVKYSEYMVGPVIKFAEKLARKWSPHKAYVMDVADTPEGLKIVEVNNLNSSGFYAGDVQKLVHSIEDAF